MNYLINLWLRLIYGPLVFTFFMKSGNRITVDLDTLKIEKNGHGVSSISHRSRETYLAQILQMDVTQIEAIVQHHKRARP